MLAADARASAVLRRLPDGAVSGVEVGVFRGGMSRRLLQHPDLVLYMVDSWEAWGDGQYRESGDYHANLTQEQQDGYHDDAVANTTFAADRRFVIRKRSVEAAAAFADASLDFVFIDADHSYEGCLADIRAWLPKVKPGGWICGHDYDHKVYTEFGVTQAVNESFTDVDLDVDGTWFHHIPGGEKLTICCVKWGGKYGPEYVNILRAMCEKNAPYHEFQCFTEDATGLDSRVVIRELPPSLDGWWNKVALFKPGTFEGKVLYLDLDVVITGRLAPLLSGGIYADELLSGYNSSVMCWESGEHTEIWERYRPEVAARLRGDQDWITELGGWKTYAPGACVSYRLSATRGVPFGAAVVVFHGEPKPHEVADGWVPALWSENGLVDPRYVNTVNNDAAVMLDQAVASLSRDLPWFAPHPAKTAKLVLCCGGPSMRRHLLEIRKLKARKAVILAVNGAHDWLIERGVTPDYQVVLDSREDNARFVARPRRGVKYLIAAQCHEAVFKAVAGHDVTLWLNEMPGMDQRVKGIEDKPVVLVGGGATVGLRSLCLGYLMGYRDLHVFGMDSCYMNGENHSYPQSMNDGETVREFMLGSGEKFMCANWMARQAMEFQRTARLLMAQGVTLNVYGDGLIAAILKLWRQEALCL